MTDGAAEAILAALARAPEIVVPLVREVPPSLVRRRPAEGVWSVHEHACHLADVHGLFFERLERMLVEPAPVITPFEPGGQAPERLLAMDLDEALRRYADDRRRLVQRLAALPPQAWERTAEHGEYSHYSVRIMFRHVALHDALHAYRIEALLLRREWAEEWRAAQGDGRSA